MSVAEAIASAGMQKYFNCIIARLNGYKVKSIAIVIDGINTYMEVITMEEIRVNKKEIIRFRVAELLRKVNKFIRSFGCRMEAIK